MKRAAVCPVLSYGRVTRGHFFRYIGHFRIQKCHWKSGEFNDTIDLSAAKPRTTLSYVDVYFILGQSDDHVNICKPMKLHQRVVYKYSYWNALWCGFQVQANLQTERETISNKIKNLFFATLWHATPGCGGPLWGRKNTLKNRVWHAFCDCGLWKYIME